MNYLSHHLVALERTNRSDSADPPEFYVGNVLPDLIAVSGDGRLRQLGIETAGESDPMTRGIRLHLETDRRFHALGAFAEAREAAKLLLQATPFSTPPRRVFFLTHAAVEIALDGSLIRADRGLADDFYRRFDESDLACCVSRAQALLRSPTPLLALARSMELFLEHRYLYRYAYADGQAEALHRLCLRAGLIGFAEGRDRTLLAVFFDRLMNALLPFQDRLLLRSRDQPAVVQ